MKRFIILFSFAMFLLLYFFNEWNYRMQVYLDLLNANSSYIYPIEIKHRSREDNPKFLQFMKKAALDNHVNIARFDFYHGEKRNGDVNEYYIFLTGETHFFDKVKMLKGRTLTVGDMSNKNLFISSEDTKRKNQLGLVLNLTRHYYSVHVLDSVLDKHSYPALYQIEAGSKEQYQNFVRSYVNYVRQDASDFTLSAEDYILEPGDCGIKFFIPGMYNPRLPEVIFVGMGILSYVYYLIKKTKQVAAMKLNGCGFNRIFNIIFFKWFGITFLISHALILIFMMLSPYKNLGLLFHVFAINFILFGVISIVSYLITWLFFMRMNILKGLKGEKNLILILLMNICFKVGISIIIIIAVAQSLVEIDEMVLKNKNMTHWANSLDYGVFDPVQIGKFDDDNDHVGKKSIEVACYNLYPYLNKKFDALYINAEKYKEDNLEPTSLSSVDYRNKIQVNPNYLKKYPVYDEQGNRITISEQTRYAIYLIPEKYKVNKDKILKELFEDRQDFCQMHEKKYQQNLKEDNEKMLYIFTKDGQKLFSFNMDVAQRDNNYIVDPIIQVVTQENAVVPDIFLHSYGRYTLYLKLINGNTDLTYKSLYDELKKYDLEESFVSLKTTEGAVIDKINDIKKELKFLFFILSVLIALEVTSIFQSVYILFQKNEYKYFVKKVFGYSAFKKYGGMFIVLIIINILELVGCILPFNLTFSDNYFLSVFVGKMLFEYLLLLFFISYFEKKSVSNVLKKEK